eukprot:COSAG01_NODE_6410_length_3681_cov_11.529592_2_plen_203_part_00
MLRNCPHIFGFPLLPCALLVLPYLRPALVGICFLLLHELYGGPRGFTLQYGLLALKLLRAEHQRAVRLSASGCRKSLHMLLGRSGLPRHLPRAFRNAWGKHVAELLNLETGCTVLCLFRGFLAFAAVLDEPIDHGASPVPRALRRNASGSLGYQWAIADHLFFIVRTPALEANGSLLISRMQSVHNRAAPIHRRSHLTRCLR